MTEEPFVMEPVGLLNKKGSRVHGESFPTETVGYTSTWCHEFHSPRVVWSLYHRLSGPCPYVRPGLYSSTQHGTPLPQNLFDLSLYSIPLDYIMRYRVPLSFHHVDSMGWDVRFLKIIGRRDFDVIGVRQNRQLCEERCLSQ